jgi:predicted ATPase
VNFEYRPKEKQLLLGANGSGKSSLLEAIRYVKEFVQGGENQFTQSTRTRWQDKPFQVVEVEAQLDKNKYVYRLEIRFASKTRQLSVNLESLTVSGTPVFKLENGQIQFFLDDSNEITSLPFETTKSSLHLAQLSNFHVRRFVEWINNSVHCFRIDAYPGTMDESADREEQQPDYELDNLAGWYRHLVGASPTENITFVTSMRDVMDGLQALRFSPDEDGVLRLRADFATPTKKKVNYSISEFSDGQRCLLALYMILHFAISKGDTVFIDEPDNFISVREIQPWLVAAEQAVEDHQGQLIIVSHHPEILNQWATDHGLRFFREENGHVRTEKFANNLEKHLQPSELIARGWEASE